MNFAYVLENMGIEDKRDNTAFFQLINDLKLDEDVVCFDNNYNRDNLEPFITNLNTGDKLFVRSVEDLADTTDGILKIFKILTGNGVVLYSCEESYLCGEDYADNFACSMKLLLYFVRRKKELGYQVAVQEGRVGRPSKTEEIKKAVAMYKSKKFTVSQIEVITGVSKSSIYRFLQEEKKG